jgi:hypothetical protein
MGFLTKRALASVMEMIVRRLIVGIASAVSFEDNPISQIMHRCEFDLISSWSQIRRSLTWPSYYPCPSPRPSPRPLLCNDGTNM